MRKTLTAHVGVFPFKKMVIIISISEDISTNNVLSWLTHYKKRFIRINPADTFELRYFNEISSTSSESSIKTSKTEVKSSDIKSIWYRQGDFINTYKNAHLLVGDIKSREELKFLSDERESLIEFFNSNIEDSKKLGSFDKYEVNKLDVLKLAVKNNINIPHTIVTSQKNELIKFKEKIARDIIMKPILDGIEYRIDDVFRTMYTTPVDEQILNNLPDTFTETCFQEKVSKKIELRIFFLKDKFYSMAIFSQNDVQTSVDFRKYNLINPNRNVPFQLPKKLERKLTRLMKDIGLNSGSIDMIYTRDKKYVFLEVNPVGQFRMTSSPCNYYLEREVAKIL